ncbi:hypothetical protein N7532_008910 [Penicillium argentinense]|uniref:Uncharacterized protein n=1 Tax=Penicillium argentinense TaxID=1131581 RepID=A0A9W9K2I0_9EURO|nr:uncharacterized protein N7532_008910 [Penicillium argentinense]KAJ5090226.1 hypothetical protein N7532_008910 [Penicillium argentinense]
MLRSFVFCAVLGLLSSASAGALATRNAPQVNEAFGLYADGDSVGVHSLFYAGGKAMVGDPSNSTSADAFPVSFTRNSASSSSPWTANPNSTTTTDSWSDEMLYIPSSCSSSDEMGFIPSEEANETTTGFIFYGQYVMVKNEAGDISSSFYIRSSSAGEGVYSLLWDAGDDDTAIPVSLRSAKPSNS